MLLLQTVVTNDIVVIIGAVGSVLTILTGVIISITTLVKVLAEMGKLTVIQEENNIAIKETKQIAIENKEIAVTTHGLVNGQSELLRAATRIASHAEGVADEKAASNERQIAVTDALGKVTAPAPPIIIEEKPI